MLKFWIGTLRDYVLNRFRRLNRPNLIPLRGINLLSRLFGEMLVVTKEKIPKLFSPPLIAVCPVVGVIK